MSVFESVRVVEVSLYIAGPYAGRILSSLGAEVIHVETSKAPDQMRFMPPKAPGACHPFYGSTKRKVALNLNNPGGRQILYKLVEKSDVFVQNFSIDAVEKWGMTYESIKKVKPDIIYIWQSGMGIEGPYSSYKAYGGQLQAITGISSLTGFPDKPPTQANTAFCDYHSALYCVMLMVGALERKRRTGKGIFIEIPLVETGVASIGPALLEYAANNRVPARWGNRHPFASPHGAYPCQGEDRWCVIAVFTDKQWCAFCDILEHPEWVKGDKFGTLQLRKRNEDELDQLIGEWTSKRNAPDVVKGMQEAGIPSGLVMKGEDLVADPHFKERNFYWQTVYHEPPFTKDAKTGVGIAMRMPMLFSATPCQNGPTGYIGKDNEYVYGELLGMSKEEIRRLEQEGALV
jgi:benzylsuccinate CoA-transferase BbsF subunit